MLYVRDLPDTAFTEEFAERIMNGAVEEQENGCIIWTLTKDKTGRGMRQIKFEGDPYFLSNIHRIIYQCYNGKIKSKKEICMHLCHQRDCVNHAHIILGTHLQNMQMEKIRYKDDKHYIGGFKKRLSTRKHEEIRVRLIKGESAYSIAKLYGIGHTSILWHKRFLERNGRL